MYLFLCIEIYHLVKHWYEVCLEVDVKQIQYTNEYLTLVETNVSSVDPESGF